ncbi:MAG: SPOR domain-containing protein [Mariprofundaceae bacterium]|nr:SPOR domain-containing protein [Mariprofundaceae bacterium]
MDYLDDDDDEFAPRNRSSRPNPVIIVALLAGAGAAAMLLWMNLGLSNRVASLEETISQLNEPAKKTSITAEIADISNQLDSVTQALANHLKSQAKNRNPRSVAAIRPRLAPALPRQTIPRAASPRATTPQATISIQPIPGNNANNRQPSGGYSNVLSNRSLPPPISSPSTYPAQNHANRGWVVNITSVSDQESAYQEVARLRRMGINAESVRAVSNGRVWYRIRVPGFATDSEARAQRGALEAQLGIRDTWVGLRD